MATEPNNAQAFCASLHPTFSPILAATACPSCHLIAQLAEEVGYLRGVLDAIDPKSDILDVIVERALKHHSELAAIRHTVSLTAKESV